MTMLHRKPCDVVPLTIRDVHLKDTASLNSRPRYTQSAGGRKQVIMIFAGLWLILLLLGGLSVAEIVSLGSDLPPPPLPSLETGTTSPQITLPPAPQRPNSALGVLGAIAGSCIGLSFLLSRKIARR
jgi:hypothetical protein